MTNIPKFTIKELIEAGAHFGHKKMRWNPNMAPYIFATRNNVHIIDLQKTAPMMHKALSVIYDVAKNNGRILFVGTKRQASTLIAESAKRCGQYYINHRWLGGMLTNLSTVSQSIKKLQTLNKQQSNDDDDAVYQKLTKKEKLDLSRKVAKLDRSLGGITEMGGKPNLVFVIDTNKEHLAIKEAKKLGIPVVGIVDSNCNPNDVEYPIPGNDDAARCIKLYCRLVSDTILNGIEESLVKSGVDLGAIDGAMDSKNSKESSEKKVVTLKELKSKEEKASDK